MAINRVRARLRFTNASGLAAWAEANMAVRYNQAISINEGLANEELKRNEVVADGPNHSVFNLDVPLMDEANAIDAFNTLNAPSVAAQIEVEEGGLCFIERHTCYHDEDPPQGCTIDERIEFEYEAPPSIAVWVQPTGAHNAYDIGDKVLYPDENGQVWVSKINANTTVPDGDVPWNRYWETE